MASHQMREMLAQLLGVHDLKEVLEQYVPSLP